MNIKILYVGELIKGSTSLHRFNALKEIGCSVFPLNKIFNNQPISDYFNRACNKLFNYSFDSIKINKKLYEFNIKYKPSVIWVDKGSYLFPSTLEKMKKNNEGVVIIHYSPDDMLNPNHMTSHYLKAITKYDLHVTTKSYNVNELKDIGAKDVLFVNNAYNPSIHKPTKLSKGELEFYSSDISFVGTVENERAEIINKLLNDGFKVSVWGDNWQKSLDVNHANLKLRKGWFPDEEYVKIISGSKINLGFLRKENRDLQTTRSVEIPACKGFLLAERTNEHMKLFEENNEAVFFSDYDELTKKIIYYLKNDKDRLRIAENGYRRCVESKYDNLSTERKILEYINANIR